MQDFKEAMKVKDELKKNTIMMIRAAILQIEKDTQKELDEAGVTDVIAKELKKRKDSVADFEKSGRQDLLDQLNQEMIIIKGYLPEELSIEELKQIITDTIKELGATSLKDMGKVMQAVKVKTAARADGKVINEIVKSLLE
jgi:uncharacterized protein YqeY